MIKGLGGSSVVIPYPEVYSALDKGVVDGGLLVPDVLNVMKIYEVTKYYTVFHPLGTCHSFSINCDVWENRPLTRYLHIIQIVEQKVSDGFRAYFLFLLYH